MGGRSENKMNEREKGERKTKEKKGEKREEVISHREEDNVWEGEVRTR